MNDTVYLQSDVTESMGSDAIRRTFDGAAIDLQDGFIHLSAAEQLVETVAKHFHGQGDLVVVAVDVASLGDAIFAGKFLAAAHCFRICTRRCMTQVSRRRLNCR
jgi:hypothetical protein